VSCVYCILSFVLSISYMGLSWNKPLIMMKLHLFIHSYSSEKKSWQSQVQDEDTRCNSKAYKRINRENSSKSHVSTVRVMRAVNRLLDNGSEEVCAMLATVGARSSSSYWNSWQHCWLWLCRALHLHSHASGFPLSTLDRANWSQRDAKTIIALNKKAQLSLTNPRDAV